MRGYVLIVLAMLSALAAIHQLADRALRNGGEYSDLVQVVDRQMSGNGLFMSLGLSPADYKMEAYARRRPDVVVLGSSRAMQFQQFQFTARLYNFGGLVYGPTQAAALLYQAASVHRPEMVIYAMDSWTFCALPDEEADQEPPVPRKLDWLGWSDKHNRLRLVLDLIAQGRLTLSQTVSLAFGRLATDRNGVDLIGLTAVLRGTGFGLDGAKYDVDGEEIPLSDGLPVWIPAFRRIIEDGTGQFPRGCRLHHGRMRALARMVDNVRAMGIHMVLVAPPFPAETLAMMAQRPDDVAYVEQWLKAIEAMDGVDVLVAHHPDSIGVQVTEFGDGVHGGNLAYSRLVLAMAERFPKVAAKADGDALARVIGRWTGRSLVGLAELRAEGWDRLR